MAETPDVDFGEGELVAITEGLESVENGNVNYSVPLELPPTVNNLAPKLALTYNSGFRNISTMGVGWRVSGLSSITRCRATYATELDRAKESRPKYTDRDRLCLDGQKLVLINGSVDASDSEYWSSSAEYTTERESFIKVVPYNNHDSFVVYTRNGNIAYYGSDEISFNSKAYRPGDFGGKIKTWGLDRVEDRYDNSYTIEYVSDSTTFEFYPKEISLEPGARIVFNYSERSEANQAVMFDAGDSVSIRTKLDSINTFVDPSFSLVGGGNTKAISYKIAYETSAGTSRLLVDSITKCGFTDTGSETCAKPITFSWKELENGFQNSSFVPRECGTDIALHATYLSDINNDGLNDILYAIPIIEPGVSVPLVQVGSKWEAHLGTNQGCYEPQPWLNSILDFYAPDNVSLIDSNIGKVFLLSKLVASADISGNNIVASTNKFFSLRVLQVRLDDSTILLDSYIPGDYSTAQIAAQLPSELITDNIRNDLTYDEILFHSENGSISVGDVNSDGQVDFYFANEIFLVKPLSSTDLHVERTSKASFLYLNQPNLGTIFADWNSDGLKDFVSVYADLEFNTAAATQIAPNMGGLGNFSTYSGYFDITSDSNLHIGANIYTKTEQIYLLTTRDNQREHPAPMYNAYPDLNGDGIKDIAYHTNNTWKVNFGTGDKFGGEIDTGVSSTTEKNQYFFASDYDGDGKDDLLVQYRKTAGVNDFGWKVLLSRFDSNGFRFEELNEDPFGGNSPINYAPTAVEFAAVFRGDFNNDGVVDLYNSGLSPLYIDSEISRVYIANVNKVDLLDTVSTGYGRTAQFTYSTLGTSDNNGVPIYTPNTDPSQYKYPYVRPNRATKVVSKISVSNGIGGSFDTYFNYYGGKRDVRGRGFLGFDKITRTDISRNKKTHTEYKLEWPFTGMIAERSETDLSGRKISETKTEYETHSENSRFVYPSQIIQKEYSLQHALLSVSKTENIFDLYGALEKQRITRGTGMTNQESVTGILRSTLVANTINNDVSNWILGFVQQSTVATRDGEISDWSIPNSDDSTIVNNTIFVQNFGTLDIAVMREYADTNMELKTTYVRDESSGAKPGIITSIISEGRDIDGAWLPERKTTYLDFQKGIFHRLEKNALDHETRYEYDTRFGVVTKVTDANALVVENELDVLGRIYKTINTSLGTNSEFIQYYCGNGPLMCPDDAVYYSIAELTHSTSGNKLGQPANASYYDLLDREVRVEEFLPRNEVVKIATEYDAKGYLYRTSEPYIGSEPEYYTTYSQYNALGEALRIDEPDGGAATIHYSVENNLLKRTVVQTIAESNSVSSENKITYVNALAEVVRAVDDQGTPVDYTYDPLGQLSTTVVNENDDTKVTVKYDFAGNKSFIDDPASGKISFYSNAFGELRKQVWQEGNAEEKSITYEYDKLGRKTNRTDQHGSTLDQIYSWVFDTRKLGLLTRVVGEGYTEEYFYNSLTQVESFNTVIPGNSAKTTSLTYDDFGRPETKQFPSGLKVEYRYSGYGYHAETVDLSSHASPHTIWRLGDVFDERGSFTHQRLGNGILTSKEFDLRNGNLINIRSGLALSNSIDINVANIQNLHYEWDSIGNLQSRSTLRESISGIATEDIHEAFVYDTLNRLNKSTTTWSSLLPRVVDYDYDVYGNLVQNQTGVIEYNKVNGASIYGVTKAEGKNYSYDAFGNVIAKGTQTFVYDVFNKPTQIGNTYFVYGPNHEKIKQINGSTETYYFDDGSYEEVVNSGVLTQRSNVGGFYVHEKTGSSQIINYLHFDHIGSVEAVTDINGNFISRMSFDAFGNRLDSDWRTAPTDLPNNLLELTWGFTGHDMVDQEGMIHMGGRVYDPAVGRFMSADLFVQAPFNTQSYNRYSYVFNNPLSLVDPSGYETCTYVNGVKQYCLDDGPSFEDLDMLEDIARQANQAIHDAFPDVITETPVLSHIHNAMIAGNIDMAFEFIVYDAAGAIDGLREGNYGKAGKKAALAVAKPLKGIKLGFKALKKQISKALKGKCCFVAGTLVLTSEGYANIEDIEVGDLVWSKNPETGEQAYKPVVELIRKHERQIYYLVINTQLGESLEIGTTDDHPFYVPGVGWKSTVELTVGTLIETDGYGLVSVDSIRTYGDVQPTYNFSVADFHTYYVTERNLLVHNENCDLDGGSKGLSSRIKENPRLAREAEVAGKSHQASIDKLTDQLNKGNLNPGIGTKPIGKGLSEARSRDGARVFFRETADGVEILGKSNKANQQKVINEVLKTFGGE